MSPVHNSVDMAKTYQPESIEIYLSLSLCTEYPVQVLVGLSPTVWVDESLFPHGQPPPPLDNGNIVIYACILVQEQKKTSPANGGQGVE